MPALAELEDGLGRGARRSRASARELDALLRDYVGPPVAAVPGLAAERGGRPPDLPQARGPQPHRRAQDQQRARPGAAGQADGQAADHRRDRRRPARRRRRRPRARCSTSSASSTWATEDMRRQKPNVERMELLGARGGAGRGGRADAQGGGLARRSATGSRTSRHPLHHRLVRRPGAVPGARARAAAGDRRRGPRADARARGPAARAGDRLRRRRLQRDRDVHPVRRRRRRRAGRRRGGGRGDRDRPPRRAADRRRARRRAARRATRRSCRTRTGQILEAHSISAGLDYPGSGPEHAWLRDSGRARYVAVTDAQALDAFAPLARLEGIIPALESSHALAWALPNPDERARPGVPVGPRRQGPRRGAGAARRAGDDRSRRRTGVERIAEAFASARANGRRAALMPYMMGGFPDLETSRADRAGLRRRRRRPVELGVPFSDPLADGPVIHAAGTAALRAGATLADVLEVGARARPARPGGGHVLRESDLRPRRRAVRRRARASAGRAG